MEPMLDSFTRHLRAENRSPRTVQSYEESVRQFTAFILDRGMPTRIAAITREHVELWMEHLLKVRKAATAAVRFRSLQQFFKWATDEGEIGASPMARMSPPKVEQAPP
ncbi:MAG: tyrosine-type recombinase/integrase, partial [Actinomycetota bacterium]